MEVAWVQWLLKFRAPSPGDRIYDVVLDWLALTLALVFLLAGRPSGYKEFYRPTSGMDPEIVAVRRPAPPAEMLIIERAQPGYAQAILDPTWRSSG
jgi:hypothetical protein